MTYTIEKNGKKSTKDFNNAIEIHKWLADKPATIDLENYYIKIF